MNCRRFRGVVHEYVEGTLSPRTVAMTDTHLASCARCQKELRREQLLASSLSAFLHHSVESRTLRPEVQQRIRQALQSEREPVAVSIVPSGLWRRFAWPRFAAVGVGLFVVLVGLGFLARLLLPGVNTNQLRAEERSTVSVQMSYCTPQYTFRNDGNLIFDTLTSCTHSVNVTLRASE